MENARVIHSGIEISAFPYLLREQIKEPVKIITPGRITPIKGAEEGIELVKELLRRNFKASLKLVGKVESQEYFKEILKTILDSHLNGVVEYLPMVSREKLARLYQEADICFSPSYKKTGASRVPLEAMASGCLVISYGNEGGQGVIRDQETGFIVPEGDIRATADVIAGMLKAPGQYREITQKARLEIEQEYSFGKYMDSIEAYLREAVEVV